MEQASLFLQLFLIAVINVAVPPIAAFVVLWLKNQAERAKMNLKAEQVVFLENLVAMAVRAAEQSGLSEQIENIAEVKKAYALDSVEKALADRNIKIDVKLISDKIEEAINLGVQNAPQSEEEDNDEPPAVIGFSIDG